ncbi:RNF213 [Mytilus coruscus]|uniref:RNF213 n=1 Tax=Mytilus coruscus TaxID=42192 RepID=A0A6J8CBT3_MYTCO|nr:RNF213 [Mytilus coruscus]
MEDLKKLITSGSLKNGNKRAERDTPPNELPKYPHCAIICGQTGCGKTEFVLDLLEGEYSGVFKYIVILCPTIQWNKAYKNREWIVREANGSLYEEEKLQELLRMFFKKYAGHPTLYIIDDCSATKELTKKKDMLSELAFSGRHAEQSVWVISQRYNSVLKDLREQTKWLCMFYTKDRDSFDNCLRENDVIPTLEERQRIKEELKKKKHRKLILKTDQPTDYWLLN